MNSSNPFGDQPVHKLAHGEGGTGKVDGLEVQRRGAGVWKLSVQGISTVFLVSFVCLVAIPFVSMVIVVYLMR